MWFVANGYICLSLLCHIYPDIVGRLLIMTMYLHLYSSGWSELALEARAIYQVAASIIDWASADKTIKMACPLSEDSDQPGHPLSLIRVFTARMKKAWVLSYPLSVQWRQWADWADAQADLNFPWAHMPFYRFCHALARFISWLLLYTDIADGTILKDTNCIKVDSKKNSLVLFS